MNADHGLDGVQLSRLWRPWSASGEVSRPELARLAGLGYRGLMIAGTQRLAQTDAEATVRLIWLLREAAACGLGVWWLCDGPVPATPELHHLSPPVLAQGGQLGWRRSARLTLRLGPGFAVIEDQRFGPWTRRVISNDLTLAALTAADRPYEPPADSHDRQVLAELVQRSLVLSVGRMFISLAVRPACKQPEVVVLERPATQAS